MVTRSARNICRQVSTGVSDAATPIRTTRARLDQIGEVCSISQVAPPPAARLTASPIPVRERSVVRSRSPRFIAEMVRCTR
jgi:hypothetical protein